jgi:hypothetical protein
METSAREFYHHFKTTSAIIDNEHFMEDVNAILNKQLSDWLKVEQPLSYRILNAQVVYIGGENSFDRLGHFNTHVLHIAYTKK